MANCYFFNPAADILQVTLNNVQWGAVYPATAGNGYQPQSMTIPIGRHDDGQGSLAIEDPNSLLLSYPDDPQGRHGPYLLQLCLSARGMSVDDDLIILACRTDQGAAAVTLTARGFVVDTSCLPTT